MCETHPTLQGEKATAFLERLDGKALELATRLIPVLSVSSDPRPDDLYDLGVLADLALDTRAPECSVQVLADLAGLWSGRVYECRKVAKAWTRHEFLELVPALQSLASPLEWSHLTLIASSVIDRGGTGEERRIHRDTYVERVRRDRLRVRDLRRLLN
jgi:hypothetical protein